MKKSFLENSRKRNLLKGVLFLSLSLCITGCGNKSETDNSLTNVIENQDENETDYENEDMEDEDTKDAENIEDDTEDIEEDAGEDVPVIDMYEENTSWSESDYADVNVVNGFSFKVKQSDIDSVSAVNVSRIGDYHTPVDYLKGCYYDDGDVVALPFDERSVSVPYLEAGGDSYILAGEDNVFICERGANLGYSLYYAKDNVNDVLSSFDLEEVSDIALAGEDYTLTDNTFKALVTFSYLGETVSGGIAVYETSDYQYVFVAGGKVSEDEVNYMLDNTSLTGKTSGTGLDSYYEDKTLSIDLNNKLITFEMPDIYYMEDSLENDTNRKGTSNHADYKIFGSEYANSFIQYQVINVGRDLENNRHLVSTLYMHAVFDFEIFNDVGTITDSSGDEWHKYTWDNSRYDSLLHNGVVYLLIRNKHIYTFYCEYGDYDVSEYLDKMISTITVSVGESGDTNKISAEDTGEFLQERSNETKEKESELQ